MLYIATCSQNEPPRGTFLFNFYLFVIYFLFNAVVSGLVVESLSQADSVYLSRPHLPSAVKVWISKFRYDPTQRGLRRHRQTKTGVQTERKHFPFLV
jgi:hypothetical protein